MNAAAQAALDKAEEVLRSFEANVQSAGRSGDTEATKIMIAMRTARETILLRGEMEAVRHLLAELVSKS